MDTLAVRIVQLEPMRVASLYGFGRQPEAIAWEKMLSWAATEERPILTERRVFGFNNPSPSPGSPQYGYEFWVELHADEPAGQGAEEKHFSGGLYAVTQVVGVANITTTWQRLVSWLAGSRYEHGSHQWLEENVAGKDAPEELLVLDLYLPIEGSA